MYVYLDAYGFDILSLCIFRYIWDSMYVNLDTNGFDIFSLVLLKITIIFVEITIIFDRKIVIQKIIQGTMFHLSFCVV